MSTYKSSTFYCGFLLQLWILYLFTCLAPQTLCHSIIYLAACHLHSLPICLICNAPVSHTLAQMLVIPLTQMLRTCLQPFSALSCLASFAHLSLSPFTLSFVLMSQTPNLNSFTRYFFYCMLHVCHTSSCTFQQSHIYSHDLHLCIACLSYTLRQQKH